MSPPTPPKRSLKRITLTALGVSCGLFFFVALWELSFDKPHAASTLTGGVPICLYIFMGMWAVLWAIAPDYKEFQRPDTSAHCGASDRTEA